MHCTKALLTWRLQPALIYEWIPSGSVLVAQGKGRISWPLIRQGATCAAIIHRMPPPEGMAEESISPIKGWAPLFLKKPGHRCGWDGRWRIESEL